MGKRESLVQFVSTITFDDLFYFHLIFILFSLFISLFFILSFFAFLCFLFFSDVLFCFLFWCVILFSFNIYFIYFIVIHFIFFAFLYFVFFCVFKLLFCYQASKDEIVLPDSSVIKNLFSSSRSAFSPTLTSKQNHLERNSVITNTRNIIGIINCFVYPIVSIFIFS